MTREQKIEALAQKHSNYCLCNDSAAICYCDKVAILDLAKECVLAGIALRDAELLERLGTFDENSAIKQGFVLSSMRPAFLFKDQLSDRYFTENNALEIAIDLARWQFEQILKAIKGDGL